MIPPSYMEPSNINIIGEKHGFTPLGKLRTLKLIKAYFEFIIEFICSYIISWFIESHHLRSTSQYYSIPNMCNYTHKINKLLTYVLLRQLQYDVEFLIGITMMPLI